METEEQEFPQPPVLLLLGSIVVIAACVMYLAYSFVGETDIRHGIAALNEPQILKRYMPFLVAISIVFGVLQYLSVFRFQQRAALGSFILVTLGLAVLALLFVSLFVLIQDVFVMVGQGIFLIFLGVLSIENWFWFKDLRHAHENELARPKAPFFRLMDVMLYIATFSALLSVVVPYSQRFEQPYSSGYMRSYDKNADLGLPDKASNVTYWITRKRVALSCQMDSQSFQDWYQDRFGIEGRWYLKGPLVPIEAPWRVDSVIYDHEAGLIRQLVGNELRVSSGWYFEGQTDQGYLVVVFDRKTGMAYYHLKN